MSRDFDIAVVGSGFAGSLFALVARSVGRSVVLIEKGTHPRFAIGESSSPLANLLLEELCDRYDLPRLKPLAAWGTWQRAYPEIGCGLKRGFTFYGHRPGQPFAANRERRDQLLVAASPRDEVADTHWYRADFDHFLVREAQAAGAEYLDQTRLESFHAPGNGGVLEGDRRGKRISLKARFVVDASGPRGFLHRALGLPEAMFRGFLPTQGLYTHFEGVERLDEMGIFVSPERPPYPTDDAAVHHVLENGWVWVLRFANGIVSAGVAAAPQLASRVSLGDGAAAWERLLSLYPTLEEQFARARPVLPFAHSALLPFRSGAAAQPGWALLPSAAAFVDPLLSTGIPLALLGIQRLAEAVERHWDRPSFDEALARYAASTLADADSAALLIAALYATFSDFELFAALCLLYFTAASFTEAAHRLGHAELAGSVLSRDHPVFGPALRSCCEEVLESRGRGRLTRLERGRLMAKIYRAIEPLDVAGLGNRSRRNWHPVEAGPLLEAAHTLGATEEEIQAMLERAGFFPEAA
ncbi:MAG: NAD(P)/FAD-dependent oxidoreductase [Thermoanaerobaculia bacterium]